MADLWRDEGDTLMNMIFTLTLRNLLSNKKRTLLTLLTIFCQSAMITAILVGGGSLVDF